MATKSNPSPPYQAKDPLQPNIHGIFQRIGERLAELEEQLLKGQTSLREAVTLQAGAEQELHALQEREDAWRTKIEEFEAAM